MDFFFFFERESMQAGRGGEEGEGGRESEGGSMPSVESDAEFYLTT